MTLHQEERPVFCVREDGITFLSQKELDDYRTQKIQQEYQNRGEQHG